jgi:hypothetical protein
LLAYVFWHVPRAGGVARAYESAHREFHDALRAANVPGLLGVEVFRLASIPWLGGKAGYEDWHLLEGSAALDVLDQAAISEARLGAHNRIASMAGDGTAGLYGLRMGARIQPAVAYWLSKPAGMSYADFESSLAPPVATGCCLWGRRMTLGPTPEFCLHAPSPRRLPHPAAIIELSAVEGPT